MSVQKTMDPGRGQGTQPGDISLQKSSGHQKKIFWSSGWHDLDQSILSLQTMFVRRRAAVSHQTAPKSTEHKLRLNVTA